MIELLLYQGSINDSLGGQPWKHQFGLNSHDNSLTWMTVETPLPVGAHVHECVLTRNKVYFIGGYNGTVDFDTVYAFDVDSNGVIDFSTYTQNRLPIAAANIAVAVYNGHLYLAGSHLDNGIYCSRINFDGSLGPFELVYTLPYNLYQTKLLTYASRLYLVGGLKGGDVTDQVISLAIRTDGSLSDYRVEANKLPRPRARQTQCVIGDRIWVFGGIDTDKLGRNTVYSAPMDKQGNLGSWEISPNTLPTIHSRGDAVVTNNTVYLIGGTVTNKEIYSGVLSARLIDGSVGDFTYLDNLPYTVANPKVIVTSSRLYLLGGTGPSNSMRMYPAYTDFNGGLNDYRNYL